MRDLTGNPFPPSKLEPHRGTNIFLTPRARARSKLKKKKKYLPVSSFSLSRPFSSTGCRLSPLLLGLPRVRSPPSRKVRCLYSRYRGHNNGAYFTIVCVGTRACARALAFVRTVHGIACTSDAHRPPARSSRARARDEIPFKCSANTVTARGTPREQSARFRFLSLSLPLFSSSPTRLIMHFASGTLAWRRWRHILSVLYRAPTDLRRNRLNEEYSLTMRGEQIARRSCAPTSPR